MKLARYNCNKRSITYLNKPSNEKLLFLFAAAMISMTAIAKEVTLESSFLDNITFKVADGLECVYSAVDSAKAADRAEEGDLRYIFVSPNGQKLYVYLYAIANLDKEKASAAPDTMLLPGLKDLNIIDRQQPVEGELDRIITIKNKNGSMRREYIGFYANGIICFSAESQSGDFTLTDQTAKSVDDSFRWVNLLLLIICIIICLIPSFMISSAWEERKSNLPKFWKGILKSFVLSIVIGVAGSLIFGFPMLKAVLWMLVITVLGGMMLCMGGTVICF